MRSRNRRYEAQTSASRYRASEWDQHSTIDLTQHSSSQAAMLHVRRGGTDWALPGLLALGYCTLVALGGLWLGVLTYPVMHYLGLMAATLTNTAVYPTARLGGTPWLVMSIAANWVPAAIACEVHSSVGFVWALGAWVVTQRGARFVGERTFAAVCPARFSATAEYFRHGREVLEEMETRKIAPEDGTDVTPEVKEAKAELIARAEEASQALKNCTTFLEANNVVADLVEELAFALGPAAYRAKSRADRRELGQMAELAEVVFDVAALVARADKHAKAHLANSEEVGVAGTMTALAEHRARGHITPLLVADVAAMSYRAQGWIGAVMAAQGFADKAWMAAYRASAQEVPANYEREANAITWMSGFNSELERKRRVGRLKQLARKGRGRSGFPRTGWVRWKPTPETLGEVLANGVRAAKTKASE